MPNGPNGPTHGPHSCDLCAAVTTLLDGYLTATATGLRESLVREAETAAARQTDLWRRHKGFDVVDIKTITKRVDEQHVHSLAAVLTWWVQRSLQTFKGEVAPLETAIVNAFRDNGITLYEPHERVDLPAGTVVHAETGHDVVLQQDTSAVKGEPCPDCDGRGTVLDAPGHVLDGRSYETPCPTCHGTKVVTP